jgi:predicted DsbA family dithiol-disulfide isomerase
MLEHLRALGAPYGIRFGDRRWLPNSRLALEAAEYARDQGKHDSFHETLFRAYFTDGLDIGQIEVLVNLAEADHLDSAGLREALRDGRYGSRVDAARAEAERLGITAIPTFVIEGKHLIVGVQSLDFFRTRLREIQAEHTEGRA